MKDPRGLAIQTTLVKEGDETELVQDSRTSDLIFDVPTSSQSCPRSSGSSQATRSSPAPLPGPGSAVFLQPGLRVQTRIGGLGTMDNVVR